MEPELSANLSDLPALKLFQMAEEKYNSLEYEEAEQLYSLAYQKDPLNQMIVLCYANILKHFNNQKEAKKILQKSIKQCPGGVHIHKRYFQLAQIYDGQEAIKIFQKGINEGLKIIDNPFKAQNKPENQSQGDSVDDIKKMLSEAYASIAEICMTDLLDMPAAQKICLTALKKGEKMMPNGIDVNLQWANYLLFKQNEEEAMNYLNKLFQIFSSMAKKNKEVKEMQERQLSQHLPFEQTLQCCKYLIEVDKHEPCLQLLTYLSDENPGGSEEVIYLQAYCCFKLNKFKECQQYVQEYESSRQQGKQYDPQVQQAMKQLKQQLTKKKDEGDTGMEVEQQQWQDVQDDD